MAETRQCQRVKYVAGGTLQYRNVTFNCRIENLSMAGALISIRNTTATDFQPGNVCVLDFYDELENRQLSIEVLIAHHAFAYAGLRFLRLDADTHVSLEAIMERVNMIMNDCSFPASSIQQNTFSDN